MKLIEFIALGPINPPDGKRNLIEHDQIKLGMSVFDVDLDDSDGRVGMQVTQQGLDVAELIYEDGEVVWIHVEPFFRKQGLASKMIEFLQAKGYPVVLPDAKTGDGKAFFDKLAQKGKLDEALDYDYAKHYDYNKLNGFWIDAAGHMLEVNHDNHVHHMDIIDHIFGTDDLRNEDGELDNISYDLMQDAALRAGWIRLTTIYTDAGTLTVNISDPSDAAMTMFVGWLVKLSQKWFFDLTDTPRSNYAHLDRAKLFDVLEHSFPRQMKIAWRKAVIEGYGDADTSDRREIRGHPVPAGMYVIYRACHPGCTSFKPMDYVTRSKKFAIGHAQHMIATEEEPYHVIKKMITQDERNPVLFDALNPGEYFYDGPEIQARVIPDDLSVFENQLTEIEYGMGDVRVPLWVNVNKSIIELNDPDNHHIIDVFDDPQKYGIDDLSSTPFAEYDINRNDDWHPSEYEDVLVSDSRLYRYMHDLGWSRVNIEADKDVAVSTIGFRTLQQVTNILMDIGYPVKTLYYDVGEDENTNNAGRLAGDKLDRFLRYGRITEARKPWLRVTPRMMDQMKGQKCQVIVELPVEQFLEMSTINAGQRDEIKTNAHSIIKYNRWSKIGDNPEFAKATNDRLRSEHDPHTSEYDYQQEYGSIHMPWLDIHFSDNGKSAYVAGHEGRHRAAASLQAGNKMIRISLCMRPGKNMFPDIPFGPEYHMTSEHLPSFIKGQYEGDWYSTSQWKIIQDDMQAGVRRSNQ